MIPVEAKHIYIASRILSSRLSRPSTMDITIADTLFSSLSFKPESVFTRFFGAFNSRPDSTLVFYLFGREDPDKSFSHVFVYYINETYKYIDYLDVEALKHCFPNIKKLKRDVEVGIINVKISGHPATYLSVLIEVIDFTAGRRLIENFEKLQVVNTDTRNLSIGEKDIYKLNHCDGQFSETSLYLLRRLVVSSSERLHIYEPGDKVENPELTLIKSNGHMIGLSYCKELKLANYILIHDNQFLDEDHYARIRRDVKDFIISGVSHNVCTRLFPGNSMRCDDKMVVIALALVLDMQPHVMTLITEREIRYFAPPDADFSGFRGLKYPETKFKLELTCSTQNSQVSSTEPHIDLVFSSQKCYPKAIHVPADSQATQIIGQNELRTQLEFWREVADQRRRIRDSIVPPVHMIEPFSDFTQCYVRFMLCYESAAKFIGKIWNSYAKTVVFKVIRLSFNKDEDYEKDARFLIYPFETAVGEDSLIIVDTSEREWIFIRPGNEEFKDASYFNDCCKYIFSVFPELMDYSKRTVSISSHFHEDCHKLHLLMSLYVIARLFRYCVALPKKIIYHEYEFRKYASNICLELQRVNSEYNVKHDLVDSNGYLLEGAYESLPSPLKYVKPSVVPKDQCMFCGERGFSNLGRHMSVKHGGQLSGRQTSD